MKYIISLALLIGITHIVHAQDTLINYEDINQKKQGYWVKKDDDNNKIYEGYFKNDVPIGEFKKYHPNGELKYLMYYDTNDQKLVEVTMYDITGELSAKGTYYDKKKDGKWTYYGSEEQVIMIEHYNMDTLDGKSVIYWQDENQNPAEVKTWKNGKLDGPWHWFYSDGSTRMNAHYKNGKLDSTFIVYFIDGSIHVKGEYNNDTRNNTWNYYNEEGEQVLHIEYDNGEVVNKDEYEKQQTKYIDKLLEEDISVKDPEKYMENPEILLYEELDNDVNPHAQQKKPEEKKGFFERLFNSKKNTDMLSK
ncbi:MAG: hypothetical protein R6U95_06540 [Bacteroidales bacterium]